MLSEGVDRTLHALGVQVGKVAVSVAWARGARTDASRAVQAGNARVICRQRRDFCLDSRVAAVVGDDLDERR